MRGFFLINLYNKISSKDSNEISLKNVVSGVAMNINILFGSSGDDFCYITLDYILFILNNAK